MDKKLGAIIFDMDGLMIDSEKLYFETEIQLAKKFGREVSQSTLREMMGRKPIESMQIFKQNTGIELSAHQLLQMRDEIMLDKLSKQLEPMKGLYEIIGKFYRRYPLAVATGAPAKFLSVVLEKLDLKQKFDVLVSSDEISKGKPHPETYLRTCEKLSLPPPQCIVLEDSTNGAMAAKSAGCYVIAVPCTYSKGQDFSFCDFTASSLQDAATHIEELEKIR